MKYITLDFNGIKTLWELHEYFKTVFQLPEYYGRNMDALWDCLHCAFDEQTTIILKNISAIPNEMSEEWQAICIDRYGKDICDKYHIAPERR